MTDMWEVGDIVEEIFPIDSAVDSVSMLLLEQNETNKNVFLVLDLLSGQVYPYSLEPTSYHSNSFRKLA